MVIYTYYALSGFGPSVRPYLWWKKYLTSLQLVSCEPQGGLCKQTKNYGGGWGSDIHAVIYTYYALSGFGPSVRPYLWWKKSLTSLQLVSFEPQGGLCKQTQLWGGGSKFQSGREENVIHAVMYTYYALSGFGPSVRPYLWWKKYLTSLQLVSCEPQGGLCKQTKNYGGVGGSDIHAVMYTYYVLSGFGPSVRPYLWWKKYLTSLQLVSCEPQGGLCKQKKVMGGVKISVRERRKCHPCCDVYILCIVRLWAVRASISLVEEISHQFTAGKL